VSAAAGARRRLPRPAILGAIAAAWLLAIAAELSGRGAALHHGALIHSRLPVWAALLLFLLAWQAMITAMMLPSSLPLIRLFGVIGAAQPRAGRAQAAFLGGYALVWTGFGAAAFLGDIGIHRGVHAWPWLAMHPWVVPGVTLAVAGMFQFSALKERCLTVCRHPAALLLRHYRRGAAAALRLGLRHGVFCLGCCWALMLVAFAAGVSNLAWMAAFTAVMVFEKTGPGGDRGAVPVGVALLSFGAMVLVHPAWLPPLFPTV
jgi:predicted metal-binding membrane protein